jgi:hypothetical protein
VTGACVRPAPVERNPPRGCRVFGDQENAHAERLHASRPGSRCRAAHAAGLRRIPQVGRLVGAPAALPHLRPRWLLRRFAQQARNAAFPRDRPFHHAELRTGRRLGLVLCRRGHDRAGSSGETSARVTGARRYARPPGCLPEAVRFRHSRRPRKRRSHRVMSAENVDPRASRIVYTVLLAAGYGAILFFLLFMFRTVLFPSIFLR